MLMKLKRMDIMIVVKVMVELWMIRMMRLVVMLMVVCGTGCYGWFWLFCCTCKSIVILLGAI